MKTLQEIYNELPRKTDKGSIHTYIQEYERLFAPYRKNSTFMELGMALGHSMELWSEYFIDSELYGVDVWPKEEHAQRAGLPSEVISPSSSKYTPIICDYLINTETLLDRIAGLKFDVILDDGDHWPAGQTKIMKALNPFMKPGSLYLIEDMQNIEAHWEIFSNINAELQNKFVSFEVIDNRSKSGRYDDVIVVYRF